MRNLGIIAFVLSVAACGPAGRDGGGDDTGGGGGVDAGGDGSGSGSGDVSVTFVYAHTASALYKVDPDTLAVTKIGNFVWSTGGDSMTDIAINKTGLMIGVSSTAVYRVDVTTAQATRLATGLTGQFNGLSFIPADMVGQPLFRSLHRDLHMAEPGIGQILQPRLGQHDGRGDEVGIKPDLGGMTDKVGQILAHCRFAS